jgi:collagenase-like PrtC family protease
MFTQRPLVIQFFKTVQRGFDCQAPINGVHGAPAVPWNAGRWSAIPFNAADFAATLDLLYSQNAGYYATFTNHLIEERDLADPVCNQMLECINRRPDLNGVIVNSEILCKYIRREYPQLRLVASITKVALERGEGKAAYYRELGERFYRYVVHPDDCLNLKLLDELDRDKAEIIVNENCVAGCRNRVHHFDANARRQRAASPTEQQLLKQELSELAANCRSPVNLSRLDSRERSCNLTPSEMRAVYDMGFRQFKLQGRGDDPWSYAYDLVRFTLNPEAAAPLVYKRILQWLYSEVVNAYSRAGLPPGQVL